MSCKHLVKRKNSSIYHYRIITPTDLKSVLIQQSLEISLSTGIHRIAQSRARKLNQFVQNLFQAYREGHMASLTMTIVKEFSKQELAKMYRWSSPPKVVHLLVWEINPILNMKGGLKWLRKDTNPKKS